MLFLLLGAAALGAGAINAIAGGGTLLTFPPLLAVISPIAANATSTVALLPGSIASAWTYRRELAPYRRGVASLAVASVIGGIVGAILLTRFPDEQFRRVVPWLLLLSALLFSFRPVLLRRTSARGASVEGGDRWPRWLWPAQLLIAVYGGYFGAAIGILMLAVLGAAGLRDIHGMNGVKSFLAAVTNAVAAGLFVVQGNVEWRYTLPMIAGAVAGGHLGARLARHVDRRLVERTVTLIAYGLAISLFLRR